MPPDQPLGHILTQTLVGLVAARPLQVPHIFRPTTDANVVLSPFERHRSLLRAAGIEDISSLGPLELGGLHAVQRGILTPETAGAEAPLVDVEDVYRLALSTASLARGADTSKADPSPRLERYRILGKAKQHRTIRMAGQVEITDCYWAASRISLADETTVVLKLLRDPVTRRLAPPRSLVIICEQLTVGRDVTFTWERPPYSQDLPGHPDHREDYRADYSEQPAYKFDPRKVVTGQDWDGRRHQHGWPGADGRDGKEGGRGIDGANAPEMELWVLRLDGHPAFDLDGQDGQDGGRGERGQDGQDGDDGRDSVAVAVVCREGPGSGGNAGNGGNGGPGGPGGRGGHGGRVRLYAPQEELLKYVGRFGLEADGGRGGRSGAGGNPGAGGQGGVRGNVWWPCTDMGRGPGAQGNPGQEGPRVADGDPGGDFGDGRFSFTAITRDQFNEALTRPAILGIDPPFGYAGDWVTVRGVRFGPGDTCVVEGVDAPARYTSESSLQLQIPVVPGGARLVQTRQQDGTLSFPGTVVVRPKIDGLYPAGRVRPGSLVAILGSGFTPRCRVLVNGIDAPDVRFIDAGRVEARILRPEGVPARETGEPVTLRVLLPDGTAESNEFEATLDTYRVLVLGDSVTWGQGLPDQDKMHSVALAALRTRPEFSGPNAIGMYATVLAHSGAVIGIGADGVEDTQAPPGWTGAGIVLSNEVPNPRPTILQQCAAPVDDPDGIDLVILNGGINDVDVDRILNPTTGLSEIRRLTQLHCHDHLQALLERAANRFPSARIIVTGYYPMISEKSDMTLISAVVVGLGATAGTLVALGIGGPVGTAVGHVMGAALRTQLIDSCQAFAEAAASAMRTAVDEVNAGPGGGRIRFALPRFDSENAVLAPRAWLYGVDGVRPADAGLRDQRAAACEACEGIDPQNVELEICKLASLGHPNTAGARAYANAILDAAVPMIPEFVGYADLHTHPLAHLGYGGNFLWGEPDGPIDSALRWCTEGHGPGGVGLLGKAGNLFLAAAEGGVGHRVGGYPEFDGWPRFTSAIHQQMYVDWLRRAHEGGLRLIVAAAVNNSLLAKEFGGGVTDDRTSVDIQIAATKAWAARHATWMEIAYTPDDARRIVQEGKLTVVLGVEVDALGNWASEAACTDADVATELKRLADTGVRLITPIHLANNAFGGTAVREDMMNLLNRFVHEGEDRSNHYWTVADGSADGIEFRAGEETGDAALAWYGASKYYDPPTYDPSLGGHKNDLGLTDRGRFLIHEMMRLGLLIDIAHMSIKATDETLAICERFDYPVVNTHTTFRDLAFSRGETSDLRKLKGEKDLGLDHLQRVARLGGIVAPLLRQGDLRTFDPRVPNDCAGTSKSFAQAYLYAVNHMGGRGVAIGSDINGLAGLPGPRFGPNAAIGLLTHGHAPDAVRGQLREGQVTSQGNGVAYSTPPVMYRGPRWESVYGDDPQAYTGEAQNAWEAVFLGVSEASLDDADLGAFPTRTAWQINWIRNVARGIRASDVGALPQVTVVDTALNFNAAAVARGAFWAKTAERFDDVPAPDGQDDGIRTAYEAVRPIWVMATRAGGTNPPYPRCCAGDRDFDINVDGVAHYGLLPDFLRDLKNIGLTDDDLRPVLESARDFTEYWAKCDARSGRVLAETGATEVVREVSRPEVWVVRGGQRQWVVDPVALEAYGGWERVKEVPDGYLAATTNLGWATLGGRLASAPAAVSWGPGQLDVVVRADDTAILHRTCLAGGGWQPFARVEAPRGSAPAICSWAPGRLDLFVTGEDRALWHCHWNGGWSTWESLGGDLSSAPSAVSQARDRIAIVARGATGDLVLLEWANQWIPWTSLGGVIEDGPSITCHGPEGLHVFARTSGGDLLHRSGSSLGWGQWEELGGTVASAPAAAAHGTNEMTIVARAGSGGLLHRSFSGGWGPWSEFPGPLGSAPGIAADASGRLEVFAVGSDDALWRRWRDPQGGWEPLPQQ